MLEPIGQEALPELRRYLECHYRHNVMLLHDLWHRNSDQAIPAHDVLRLSGYRLNDHIVAVQGHYASGRWFPFFSDPAAIDALVQDALRLQVRWLMGAEQVVAPLLDRLTCLGRHSDYDEQDYVYQLRPDNIHSVPCPDARRAKVDDIPAIAHLRRCFDAEYFGSDPRRISQSWCLRVAGEYVRHGAIIAERQGQAVAMAATEASIPQLAQIGAVYTLPAYRNQGLAKQVVFLLCQLKLARQPQVILTVRKDNLPALRAYAALGFTYWGDYRMVRLR